MKPALRDLLVDPIDLEPLALEVETEDQEDVHSGLLRAINGTAYPIQVGIPRFVVSHDAGQQQTGDAFAFKWAKRDTYDSAGARANALAWYVGKYGFPSAEAWTDFYASRSSILDVGCGSGFSSSLWLDSRRRTGLAHWVGVAISAAVDDVIVRSGQQTYTDFIQADC